MPAVTKSRRYARRNYRSKRRYRRRPNYAYKARPSRTLVPTGFPVKKTVKLRYCQEVTLDAAAGGVASHVFRANSVFDPDLTGVGHQPLGYDQWAVLYDQCTVTWAKMTVSFAPTGAASTTPGYWGILISDDGTRVASASNISHLMEHRYLTRSKGVIGESYHLANSKNAQLSTSVNVSKFLGKKNIVGASEYQHTQTGNPAEMVFFELWMGSVGGNNPAVENFLIQIDYIVTFTEPRPLSQS